MSLKNNYQQSAHFTLSCRTWLISVAILVCLIANGISKTNAVPTDSTGGIARTHLLQRALRDVAAIAASLVQEEPKDTRAAAIAVGSLPPSNGGAAVVAAVTLDEASSSIQPQGQCLLDGVLVAETTVLCEKQVGCRAIQKTGHCCPDYKCDCEKDGKTYLNGDKLVDPETPCTVCYCQGGEILCSSVTCFHRDDCTPKYIAVRCCPEYDNCPIASQEPNITTNKTITDALNAPTTSKPEVPAAAMNPKITIKEITKPSEIRITDDNKAIPIHQMLKPSSTTEAPTTTTTAAAALTTTTTTAATTMKATVVCTNDDLSSAKISPIRENTSVESNRIKTIGGLNNESLKLKASVAYASTEVSQANAPTTGGSKSQHKIAMIDKSDEQQFSDFGTAGLQRIENESANDSTSKVNIKREFLDITEVTPTASTTAGPGVDEFASSELMLGNSAESTIGTNAQTGNLLHSLGEPAEPDTAGSDNIYHIILTTDGPRMSSSTESYLALKGSATTEGPNGSSVDEANLSAEDLNMLAEQQPASNTTEGTLNIESSTSGPSENEFHDQKQNAITEGVGESSTSTTSTTETSYMSSSTDGTHQQHHLSDDDDIAIQIESNPAYPTLPEDDFSLREVNSPLSETDDIGEVGLRDESRSIGGSGSFSSDSLKSTKQLDESLQQHINSGEFGSGMSIDGMMPGIESSSSSSSATHGKEFSSDATSTTAKIALMYSAEDTSAETDVSNSSDFHMSNFMKESENETGSGDSLEIETMDFFVSGSGSGAGADFAMASSMVEQKSQKQREPTTARPKRKLDALDIDELGSANEPLSPEEDPKLDVESLKLDDNQENDVIKTDAGASKSNILSLKTNAAQDKTVTDGSEGLNLVIGDQQGGERVQRLYLQRVY